MPVINDKKTEDKLKSLARLVDKGATEGEQKAALWGFMKALKSNNQSLADIFSGNGTVVIKTEIISDHQAEFRAHTKGYQEGHKEGTQRTRAQLAGEVVKAKKKAYAEGYAQGEKETWVKAQKMYEANNPDAVDTVTNSVEKLGEAFTSLKDLLTAAGEAGVINKEKEKEKEKPNVGHRQPPNEKSRQWEREREAYQKTNYNRAKKHFSEDDRETKELHNNKKLQSEKIADCINVYTRKSKIFSTQEWTFLTSIYEQSLTGRILSLKQCAWLLALHNKAASYK